MSEHFTLEATSRTDLGKGASRRLRRNDDLVPAIIYGGKKAPQTLSLVHKDILKLLNEESFFSSILTLSINGKKEKAILKALQRHAYKPRILHMDFMRVSATEKLHMHVPIHFTHEDACVGVKLGGLLNKHMVDLEIKCLPADLPESIDINVGSLAIGDSVHLADVKLPKGVELAHAVEDEAHNQPVVSVTEPRTVELVEEGAPVTAEVPSMQKQETEEK